MASTLKKTSRNWNNTKFNNTLALDLPKIDLRMTAKVNINSILSPNGTQSFFKAKRYSKVEKSLYKKPIRISPLKLKHPETGQSADMELRSHYGKIDQVRERHSMMFLQQRPSIINQIDQ